MVSKEMGGVQDLLPKLSEWVSLKIYKLLEATGITVNNYNLANSHAHAPLSDLHGKDWGQDLIQLVIDKARAVICFLQSILSICGG